MALRLSTGLRNKLMDYRAAPLNPLYLDTISYGDGTGTDSRDEILDSGNGLGDYVAGDKIIVSGSTSNDGTYEILSVAAGSLEVAAGSLTTEIAGDNTILCAARGGSFADIFRQGIIRIRTGTQPADADTTESGTLLVEISQASAAFVADTFANGLNFGEVSEGTLAKESGETWSGVAGNTGTAGWFRFYANDVDTGASTTAIRFDGSVATSGAQLNMSNTTITSGGTTTIDTVSIPLPANS